MGALCVMPTLSLPCPIDAVSDVDSDNVFVDADGPLFCSIFDRTSGAEHEVIDGVYENSNNILETFLSTEDAVACAQAIGCSNYDADDESPVVTECPPQGQLGNPALILLPAGCE